MWEKGLKVSIDVCMCGLHSVQADMNRYCFLLDCFNGKGPCYLIKQSVDEQNRLYDFDYVTNCLVGDITEMLLTLSASDI